MTKYKPTNEILSKLFPYQHDHVEGINYSLSTYNRCLDASDTGTGKTYTAIASCVSLGLKPFIICPKSVVSSWCNVLSYFNCDWYGISNYEKIQNCKMFTKDSKNNTVDCPYIKRMYVSNPEKEKDNSGVSKKHKKKESKKNSIFNKSKKLNNDELSEDKIGYTFIWQNLPTDIVFIFDESHRCKNPKTLNSVLLYTLAKTSAKIMIISATVSDKPENFAITGYVLGLYKNIRDSFNWMTKIGASYSNVMSGVNDYLYPEYATRMRIRDLGNLFPDNQMIAECYDMDNANEIEKEYKLIETEVNKLKNKEENSSTALARILYARMRIETLKVPTFIELAKKYLSEGNAVAIFVNFTQSLKTIADELKTTCVIHGQQSIDERNKAINDFNDDIQHMIVCNIRSGGCGISLHDQNGNFPRVSIISPSWSAQDIIQVLGRVHRANGKTPVRQRIVFCKGTIEEEICKNMKQKIQNIAHLNDGDLLGYNIDGLTDDDNAIGIDKDANLSEFDKLFMKINVLNTKKERLQAELKETKIRLEEEILKVSTEIKNLEYIIQNYIDI
jgi:hypothetical protein